MNIDFKKLWTDQSTPSPNVKELLKKIEQQRKQQYIRIIYFNVILAVTAVFILLVWIYFQPTLISTKAGILIIIVAMLIFGISYSKSLPILRKNIHETSNIKDFLTDLIALRKRQQFIQTTMLNIYFLLFSLGIGLYTYEYAIQMGALGGTIAYCVITCWIVLNWFLMRPWQIKRQEKMINGLIDNLTKVSKQLE